VNVAAPFDGRIYIADTSVWNRLDRLPPDVQEEWQQALDNQWIATSPLVIAELLYSTQNLGEFDYWSTHLGAINRVGYVTAAVQAAAVSAWRELATQGATRSIKFPDVYVAAAAHIYNWGVLHYDGDFDRFAALNALNFESRWIADRSLGL
jgi:predicted nucleic acid-binding protein